jgi:hypothetical protein
MIPVLAQWHHSLLILVWNSALLCGFLPGTPMICLLLAFLSFGFSWLNGLLSGAKFLRVPELTRPMVFLGMVVLVTGYLRGGVGIRVFGNASFGGRAYFFIFGAIIGYFALSAMRIPMAKASRSAGLYFLSGITFVASDFAYLWPPLLYFFANYATSSDPLSQFVQTPDALQRFLGITKACNAVMFYFLIRWGIQGIFSLSHPWRGIFFIVAFLLSLAGGFRSNLLEIMLVMLCLFCVEGLWRTRFLPIAMGMGVAGLVLVFAFSEHLPLSAQRAVSFLPVKVDAGVASDAGSSSEWRYQMWRVLVPQIPHYLLLGKGYAIDPDELYFAMIGGGAEDINAQASLVSGDYHSGPLSTIIPLGLWGLIGFLWLLGAGAKVLYQNYRNGDPALRRANAFFLAYFIAQAIGFFGIFGSFSTQLAIFAGVLGMSVSLNGGVRRPSRIVVKLAKSARAGSMIPVRA